MARSFDETNQYISITDHADLTLPDSNWCVGIWTYVSDLTGSGTMYCISNNLYGANNSFNLVLYESGHANAGKWECRTEDGAGDALNVLSANAPGADSTWRLIICQRVTNTLQLYFITHGATPVSEGTDTNAAYDASDGADWHIAARNPVDADRYFGGTLCEFFKGDFNLTTNEMQALGMGRRIWELGKDLDVYLPMWGLHSPEIDLTSKNHSGTLNNAPPQANHAPLKPFITPEWGPVRFLGGAMGPISMAHSRRRRSIGMTHGG